ncbi:hypothetical protein BSKO_03742 [Bryopsis sp. KO-2023]|nr:hypothetical protein BSKO_03742 [Bryopsis sp. KO-2023]
MGSAIRPAAWCLAGILLLGLLSPFGFVEAFFGGESAEAILVDCSTPFYINPDASKFQLSGFIDEPETSVLEAISDSIGALGSFELSYSGENVCPQTAADIYELLLTADHNVSIVTAKSIEIYPELLLAKSGLAEEYLRIGQPKVSLTNSTVKVSANVEDTIASLEVNLRMAVEHAQAYVGPPTPEEANFTAKGGISERDLTVSGVLSVENSTLSFRLADVVMDMEVAGPALDSNFTKFSATTKLKGEIISKAVVGCFPDCGANGHGKCGLKDEGGFTCLCECGWVGANCDEPKGFCPKFSDLFVEPEGTCEGRTQQDPTTRECTRCVDGWKGEACEGCESDQACNAFWEDSNMMCKKDATFFNQTQLKTYSCDFRGSPYQNLIGDTIVLKCNITGPEKDAELPKVGAIEDVIEEGPWCELELTWEARTPVRCIAVDCDFKLNTGVAYCKRGVCECNGIGGKCTGQAGELFGNGVEDIDLACTPRAEDDFSQCDLTFGSIAGVTLSSPCYVSECLDPDSPITIGNDFDDGGGFNWELIVLGVPLFFSVAIGLCVSIPGWSFHCQINKPPGELKYGGAGMQFEAPSASSEIRFTNVTCSVPKRKTAEEKREEGGVLRRLSAMTNFTDDMEDTEKLRNPLPQLKGLTHEVLEMLKPPRRGYKSVLQDISCSFKTGEMVGIMGPSGSGKSTFLSVLSGMSLFGDSQRLVKGRITVNGKKRGSWIRKLCAFVPQEDNILAMLTVRECLMYSAILRLPITTSMDTIFHRVFSVLSELNLERVADCQVGGVRGIRGISGGEKRRVTIGMEMVTRPTIILMDEPTSGLDSHTALSLTQMLKVISEHGRLVMLSMHQPSPAMFNMLDKVLLLAYGFPIFNGPPSEVDAFFKSYGRPVPRGINPAEHMLAVVSHPESLVALLNGIFIPKLKSQEEGTASGGGNLRRAGDSIILEGELSAAVSTDMQNLNFFGRTMRRWRKTKMHLQVAFWRGFVDIVRNPVLLLAHWLMAVVMGLGLGFIFYDVQKDFAGAQNRLGGFFFFLAFLAFTSSTTVDVVHAERSVVLREVKAGYYSPFVYLLSKIILDTLLLRAIPAILLGIPFYMLMGLEQDTTKFFIFLFSACTFNMIVGAFAMVLTILIMNSGAAALVINIAILVSLLFANFPANSETIPVALKWINHLSVIGYGLRIMTINEIEGSSFVIDAGGGTPKVTLGGEAILHVLGFEKDRFEVDVIVMMSLFFGAVIMVMMSVWFRTKLDSISRLKYKVQYARQKRAFLKSKAATFQNTMQSGKLPESCCQQISNAHDETVTATHRRWDSLEMM